MARKADIHVPFENAAMLAGWECRRYKRHDLGSIE
jgi:hypothetical protein